MKKLILIHVLFLVISASYAQTPIYLPGFHGTTYFREGSNDGGTLNDYNTFLSLHYGLAFGSPWTSNGNGGFEEKATISFNGRTGDITSLGNINSFGSISSPSLIGSDNIYIPSYFNSIITKGTGDGGTLSTYNVFVKLHYGLAFGSPWTSNGNDGFEEKATVSLDGRSGDIFTIGKIGIGTISTGSHKLAVEGSIGAREIKVQSQGWSDFVFYDDYELLTLEEVESYITNKKHLPEIPSEAEIKENGINLGEMDAKLLQKIEELTLYLIEQNKEIKELNLKNSRLEERLNKLER